MKAAGSACLPPLELRGHRHLRNNSDPAKGEPHCHVLRSVSSKRTCLSKVNGTKLLPRSCEVATASDVSMRSEPGSQTLTCVKMCMQR